MIFKYKGRKFVQTTNLLNGPDNMKWRSRRDTLLFINHQQSPGSPSSACGWKRDGNSEALKSGEASYDF
jgi:hypothetical protein